MKTIIINGKNIKSEKDLHLILKDQFNFPDYYGENLSALWDCLSELSNQDFPITIEWKNFNESKLALGDYQDKVFDVFVRAKRELSKYGEIIIILS